MSTTSTTDSPARTILNEADGISLVIEDGYYYLEGDSEAFTAKPSVAWGDFIDYMTSLGVQIPLYGADLDADRIQLEVIE